MKILAMEHEIEGVSAEQFQLHRKAEAARAWELYQEGVLREMYCDASRHTAILILECESLEAARDILATLPLVQQKLIYFDLYPLEPYTGFSRLFGD